MIDHQEAPQGFTQDEWNALVALRDTYRRDPNAPRSIRPFDERYGISCSLHPQAAGLTGATVYWHCSLHRRGADGSLYRLTAIFCVVPEMPHPPVTREILQWLAMGVAHRLVVQDRCAWAALYLLNRSGQTPTPTYRGIVRRADSLAAFEHALASEHQALWGFLGPDGFAELMSSVGIEAPPIDPFFFVEGQSPGRNA